MEIKQIGWLNAILIFAGIISFILGLFDNINSEFRTILFIASPTILAISCLFIFLTQQDKIIKRLDSLEEKLKRNEDLNIIRTDIEVLKREKR